MNMRLRRWPSFSFREKAVLNYFFVFVHNANKLASMRVKTSCKNQNDMKQQFSFDTVLFLKSIFTML